MINLKMFKHSVLNQAVKGKLTTQSATDGNASDLLITIANHKRQLVQAKKISNTKPSSKIKDNEIPFKIPNNWQWTRLNTLTEVNLGRTPAKRNKSYWNNGTIPWVSVSDLNNGLIKHTINHITDKASNETFKNQDIVPKGTLLMSFKLTIGKMGILDKPMYHNEAIASFPFYYKNDTLKQYMFYVLPILCHYVRITPAVKGKTLNKTKLKHMLVPLPPLTEQKRIVANIKKCYKLADLIQRKYQFRTKFIYRLKQSFLQQAMKGKLTKQLASDGTGRDLINKIQQHIKYLVDNKKISKPKHLKPISKIPYQIPKTWQWTRLNLVGIWRSGSTPKRSNPSNYKGNIPWLKTGDLNDGYINKTSEHISQNALDHNSLKMNPKGSVLIAMYGGTIAKLGIANINLTTNQACCACIPYINNKFIFYYLLSQRQNLIHLGEGGAQPNISRTKIIHYPVPLPPLPEQQRIVKVLKHLFSELKFK